MGNLHSIWDNPQCSPYTVFTGDYFHHPFRFPLQWSEESVGCVDASWILVYFAHLLSTVIPPVDWRTVVTIQILDFSFCAIQLTSLWPKMAFILQITHGATMCILVVTQFVRQSLQMYHVAKQWQLNQYMTLLVRQGILYFFVYVFVSSFPSLFFTTIRAHKITDGANGDLSLQHPPVFPHRFIEFIWIRSKRRMAVWPAVHTATCAHVHSNPSIHLEHSRVVCAWCAE